MAVNVILLMSMILSAVSDTHMSSPSKTHLNSFESIGFQRECEGYDEEWGACPGVGDCSGPCVPHDCLFAPWQEWFTTGGCTGLRYRRRAVQAHNNECGKACTGSTVESAKQTGSQEKCDQDRMDCKFSAWTDWTRCSSSLDQSLRFRTMEQPAGPSGNPCQGPLKETKACAGMAPASCTWTQWNSWGRCSVSCGAGRHERMRRVQKRADPGGQPCWGASLENGPCNNGACPKTDCKLGQWAPWSECDVLNPQRFRRRSVEVAPSNGGHACSEYLIQTVACYAPSSAGADCDIGMWSEWSSCTKSCDGGQTYRQRKLLKPNTEGGFCHDAVLHMARPCGLGSCVVAGPKDCAFAPWSQWSDCDALCGKGNQRRNRKIAVQATEDGRGCEGSTDEISPCQQQSCEVVDCKWSDWYDWSVCSASCDGGTKRRERNVAVAPQHGGKLCAPNEASELAPCSTMSCDEACLNGEWASWSGWTECSATCNVAYKSRRRDVAVQPSHCGKPAVGFREEFQKCINLPACNVKQDCQMSEWGEWSQCSCHCFGIRERNRAIAQFATEGGKSCNGTVKEIIPCNPAEGEEPRKECGKAKRRTDCVLADWAEWSLCSRTCGGGQKERKREIELPSAHGGTPCNDSLGEILPCGVEACPTSSCHDCVWGEWGQWGSCSKCGGQRFRYRNIEQMPNYCGRACEPGDAKEAGPCFSKCENELFCTWTYWSTSESCNKCGSSSMTRNRALGLRHDAGDFLFMTSDDSSCAGTQLNVTTCTPNEAWDCDDACHPEPCLFSEWGDWTEPTCLGLCERKRGISQHNNECGEGCDGPLVETKTCPVVCQKEQDCEFGAWSDWTECDASLGETSSQQMNRVRDIVKMPMNGGSPCSGQMRLTKPCPKIPRNCILSAWDAWSDCSTKCVEGWHTRQRRVDQTAKHGGEQCAGALFEIDKCPGTDPSCSSSGKLDCTWKTWEEWTHCDSSGQMSRKRTIAQLPSIFGEPCEGPLSETASCDSDRIDCDVSPWSAWDSCDRTCDGGQRHRHREIQRYPSAGGTACPSVLMETMGCNRQSCSGHDCFVSAWGQWGFCSTTCGVGQQTRSRTISGLRGTDGHGCYDILGEVKECRNDVECISKDCAWGEWAPWSYCSRSCDGGVRSRKRHIMTIPSRDGRQCDAEIKEIVQPCNTHKCSQGGCEDGSWDQWSDWSLCSVSCSRGTTFRTRQVAKGANACGKFPEGLSSETRICVVDAPCVPERDCEFGAWGHWGPCSASCDGMQERSRAVKNYGLGHGLYCHGPMKELRPCHPVQGGQAPTGCRKDYPVDCRLGEWTRWSRCTAECDGGVQRRTRVVEQRAVHGGRGCLAALSEVQECNRQLCNGRSLPVDCQLGEWLEWGPCKKCAGERTRFRHILRYASNGGRTCGMQDVRELGQCPRDCSTNMFCTWTSWQDWGTCSKTCGRGAKRRRRRYLHLSHDPQGELGHGGLPPGPEGKHGGYPTIEQPERQEFITMTTTAANSFWKDLNPSVHTYQKYDVIQYKSLYQRGEDLESSHVQELIFAFFGGFMSLLLILQASRIWSSSVAATGNVERPSDASDDTAPLVSA
eukprot:TRINITY_DN25872_c0_g1_i1.p1 TRINITY_DN25872_c0_g1~~TRINITY_DN25872_c0_g1_i1.p1  ORF type:complete len:1608 (-),score=170.55 TRINITY_DN25872_c0_g1_i1:154-4899(-)